MSLGTRMTAPAALGSHLLLPGALVMGGEAGVALAAAWALLQAGITIEILRPRSQVFGRSIWHGPRGPAAAPRVALTLDDGPSAPHTEEALRHLEACGARATFFFVGRRAAERPDLVRRVVAAGHEIGVHSLTHPWWFALAGPGRLRREVVDASRAIAGAGAPEPRWFRPPMGHKNVFLAPILGQARLSMVTWTVRAYDTVRRDPAPLVRELIAAAAPGSILLLHEEGKRDDGGSALLGAIPDLVAGLRARGLEPVTLRDLLEPPP